MFRNNPRSILSGACFAILFQTYIGVSALQIQLNAFDSEITKMGLGPVSRESFIKGGSFAAIASTVFPKESFGKVSEAPPPSSRPLLWTIDEELPPNMQGYTPKGEKRVLKQIAQTSDIVYLGEHHNSAQDHNLQADLISQFLKERKKMAIGLEMVQQKFQPALDAYIAKKVPDLEMADKMLFEETEWETRWFWPFENYLPVFHLAREQGLPLIALNVDSESLTKVRNNGFDGLTVQERQQYVSDPQGFIAAVKDPGFKIYSDRVILSSFEDHVQMGIYQPTLAAQRNFFASRILWDEAMADRASKYVIENPGTLMAVMIGSDHVKFGFGSPWRLDRLLNKNSKAPSTSKDGYKITTIMLNPTAQDSLSGSTFLRLKLGLDGERFDNSKPLADYLLFSSSPKVNLLSHPLNPIS